MRKLAAVLALSLSAMAAAPAAELKTMITTAMKDAVDELIPPFEKRNAHKVQVTYGPSGGLARRFRDGEPADMILIAAPTLDALMIDDKVLPGSTEVSRTGIGIAVKKGAPQPDVSTAAALRAALLAARSVGHTAPAGGGITARHMLRVFERLGIAAEVAAKARLATGGPDGRVSTLVASGEAEIGFQQVSELMSNPDVEVIGLLPPDLQQVTIHLGAITATAKEPDAAREFLRYLTWPEALAIYKKKGLALGM